MVALCEAISPEPAMIAARPDREITRAYEPFDEDLPNWYRDAVARTLTVQARIESAYPLDAESAC